MPLDREPRACGLRRGRPRRSRGLLRLALAALCLVLVAGAALRLALAYGPIPVDWLRPAIAQALQDRLGAGYDFKIGAARIEQSRRGPTLMVDDLALRNGAGAAIIAAPRAELTISPLALFVGSVRPKSLELYDVEVRLAATPTGALTISAGAEPIVIVPSLGGAAPEVGVDAGTAPVASAPATVKFDALKPVGAALAGLLDLVTGQDSGLNSLERVGVARGKLVIEDRAAHATRVFDDLAIGFDKEEGRARLTVSANGSSGRWSLSARAGESVRDQRMLDVDAKDLSIDEIAMAIGARDLPFACDMPLSAQLRVGVGEDGALTTALGRFTFGAGYFVLDDPDHEPVLVDELSGAVSFDDKTRTFTLEPTQYLAADTSFNISGTIAAPSAPGEPWRIEGESAPGGVFGVERPGDRPVAIDKARLAARVWLDERRISLDSLAVKGPQADLVASGEAGIDNDGPRVKGHLSATRTRISDLVRLWPTFSDPEVRAFLLAHATTGLVETGSLDLDFNAATLKGFRTHLPPPDASLRVEGALSDVSIVLLPGMPPLAGASATVHITGRSATINQASGYIDGGANHRLQLSEIAFNAPQTDRKPTAATVSAHATASVDTIADLLGREALKPFGGMQIDASTVKGQVDARLNLDLKLGKPADTAVRASAQIANLSIDKLVGKERFDNGALSVTADASGLKASGQGRLFGAPATIDMTRTPGGVSDATVVFSVDDAARGRLGLNLGSGFSGPVGVRLVAQLGAKEPVVAQLELDLARAAITNIPPGFSKPAGKPAKATLNATQTSDGLSLDQIVFDIPGGPGLRGSVLLDSAGAFRSARFTQARVSPGDDMKVDADQTKEGLKLVVRASEIDARPFIKALVDGSASKDAPSKDIELDLHTALATGANRQALSNVDLKLTRRGGWVRNFSLQAKSGRASIVGGMSRAGTEAAAVTLNSTDGGGLLSFVDLYKHMEGGKLQLTARVSDGGFNGTVLINDFLLRDEPALRRIVTEGVARIDASGAARIDTNAAPFNRLSATFSRGSGELVIRDGVLFGSQIGVKLDGTLDTKRDQVAMTGVFVPAYGLNNLFSQLPVVGLLLGGGAHEGLFAINFRISGPASAPVLTINPLSAIAPGFLRKIFGAIDGTGSPPTGEPLPQMPMAIGPRGR